MFIVVGWMLATAAVAAPRIPAADAEILERLAFRRSDPAAQELQALRRAHLAAPGEPAAAARLARRYFELASAEGDPRYIGYAEAALRPWAGADAPTEVLLVRALLRQYRHDFPPALEDLARVIERDPANREAMFWRAALYLAGADYDRARAECARMEPVASRLTVLACKSAADSVTGGARAAYDALAALMAAEPPRDPEFRVWVVTRLGEMAQRFGDDARAERHFREALEQSKALGAADPFVLAAYADLLLDLGRAREVLDLLRGRERSDILLVRLALAQVATGDAGAAASARALRDRFEDAARRGDRLHLQEESRCLLALQKDPKRALEAARENWKTQREPRDARVLMEAALAAGDAAAARDALDWMARTGYEEPRYRALAERLRGAAK